MNNTPVTAAPRTRRRVERPWPPIGTILVGHYHGQTYRAEVVQAWKPLKSGKQIRILTGSAAGRRANSFSRAMLKATSRQRREHRLGVKGFTNGWEFWRPANPAAMPASSAPATDTRNSACSVQPCPMLRKNAG